MRLSVLGAVLLACCFGQQRDFLTADEVDQVRLAQEPNLRLKLYTDFARLRVELLKQMIAKERPGRSALIHSTLEDYIRIIETIDVVTDDALRRNADLTEGTPLVAKAEEEMLSDLKKIEESDPKDLGRYKFVLTSAIEATEDSLEMAREDLAKRKHDANVRVAEEKKEREALMTPADAASRRVAEQKKTEEEQKQKRKAPTLRRKGEVAPPRKP